MGCNAMFRVISLVFIYLFSPPAANANSCTTLGSLTWLVGNWDSKNSELKISESWNRVSDKTFEGSGQTYSFKKNKIVSSETLRLVEMSGEIFYLAKVKSNDLPVAFKLTHCTENSAIFENSQHDFPKKINYKYERNKGISVFVSGENGEGFLIEYASNEDS